MTNCASAVGRAASSSVSTLTPENRVSNFDQVVTQWMSPRYSEPGRACASSQLQVVGRSTRPSTVMLHVSGVTRGVGSAVSTGQSVPTSYWPGGSRGSRCRRPRNPRVGPGTSVLPGEGTLTRAVSRGAYVAPATLWSYLDYVATVTRPAQRRAPKTGRA